ncbi:DUF1206 domain-containing protein [Roseomonas sp. AR75]|uniref:DUF1206 domain-containing protein n=1 Tax=Roseomonas sp. AR75 TaxID=2562311 RepID=UPI0010C155BB|nr:DUF1206 domain-containing protein [Roseomonas sp. AR75]
MPGTQERLELLARLGYAARGMVSLIIGGLALLAAFGRGGGTTGSRGALQTLMAQPLGVILLGIVAVGLFGFALWRLFQSVMDADGRGTSWKAIGVRIGQAISAAIYVSLGAFAASLVLGLGKAQANDDAARDWTAWLMAQPFGYWIVGAGGIAVAGIGLAMARKAWTASFRRELAGDAPSWVIPLGRLGFAARAIVFLVIGGFLLVAAWTSNPDQARGLGGALAALQAQPFGQALFALVALGLAAFGAFQFAEARYRHIGAPDPRSVAAAAKARLA